MYKIFICLFLLLILLPLSCNKSTNNRKEQNAEQNIIVQNEINNSTEQGIAYENEIDNSAFEKIIREINENILGNLNNLISQAGSLAGQTRGNIANEIAVSFASRKDVGIFPGESRAPFFRGGNVLSINPIIPETGYYIQQAERGFQGNGHAPEILVLTVENEKAYIREIDILNGQIIIKNTISLQFNGRTYVHNSTKLETHNGKMQIIYSENIPEQKWAGNWGVYENPFTYAGSLSESMPDKVLRLTSDYLKIFAGSYIFDSYKTINSENASLDIEELQNAVLNIAYNQEIKCLTIPVHDLIGFYENTTGLGRWDVNFVETTNEEPFYWVFGEGHGFVEARFYFYKGGIAFTCESSSYNFDSEQREYIKYVVFFKKEV